jgi:DNA-binding FrmR family transcriptional regulator
MIHEGRYCVDILRTLNAAVGAIKKVEDQILKRHLNGCVTKAFQSASEKERGKKVDEITSRELERLNKTKGRSPW